MATASTRAFNIITLSEKSCDAATPPEAARLGRRRWRTQRCGRRFGPAVAVLAGGLELAAQELRDLTQAGDLGLERSRCVAVRRLGMARCAAGGQMRWSSAPATRRRSLRLPLTLPALIAHNNDSVVLLTSATVAAAAARARLMAMHLAAVRAARSATPVWLPAG
jgi:hypothetical protein